MNLLYTPVLTTGPLPRGDLLKATSSQEERAHKALQHYITAVRAQLSIEGEKDKGIHGFTVRVQRVQTDRRGGRHLRDTGKKQCTSACFKMQAHTHTYTQDRRRFVGELSAGQWATS